jgi:membrane protease YdiL (CAAX protease family)
MMSRIKRWPLVAFYVLVFATLWLLFLVLRATVHPLLAVLIGSWLPDLIAVLVVGVAEGRPGLRALFGRVVRWRFGARWYAIALLGPIAVTFLAVGVYALLGNPVTSFAPARALLPIALAAIYTGATGEELGWRGFALPRMQARWNALVSSLILGVLWGLYHYPAWLIPGTPQESVPFAAFMLGVLPFTVFISWVFNHARGSLIVAFLAHFAFNFAGGITGALGVSGLFWITVAIWWVVATAIVALDWTRLTRPATARAPAAGAVRQAHT